MSEKTVDVVILTDDRYENPVNESEYVQNVLLEDRLVSEALIGLNLSTERVSWSNKTFKWENAKCLLFRSTWDYFDRYPEFKVWLERTKKKSHFINSYKLVQWNLDKHYLSDLEHNGIRIPPTLFIEKNQGVDLVTISKEKNWPEMVLKPCVSGGGRHTYRFSENETAKYQKILDRLLEKEAMMLQPLQKNVITEGEKSIMIINLEFTHAVIKKARAGEFRVQDDFGGTVAPYIPTQNEVDFALKTVKACFEVPVYARVDIFTDNEDKTALAELELIEPEMWFRQHGEGAVLMAEAVNQKIESTE